MRPAMKTLLLLLLVPLLPACASLPALHAAAAAAAAQAGTLPVAAAAAAAAGVGLGVGVLASDDIKKLIRDAELSEAQAAPGTFGALLQDNHAKAGGVLDAGIKSQHESAV